MLSPLERLGFDRRMTRDEINSLPIGSYNGKIRVINSKERLDKALDDLHKENILGFDTETRPNFKKGQNNLPALVQLAGENIVYIFQLNKIKFPVRLRKILANGKIIKTGVAVDNDIIQLQRLGTFTADGFIGLASVAKSAGVRNHGLRGLAAVLLGFRISKGAQRSNWASEHLSEKQIRYAATDAWVGREIFLRFQEMGVIYPDLFFDE